jgi:hypothetical protein
VSGYFAALMRQTGIGPAAPGFGAGFASPAAAAPPEAHLTVDAAPPPSVPSARDAAPAHRPSSPAVPFPPSLPELPGVSAAGFPIRASEGIPARPPASLAPPEVTTSRAAAPSPSLVVPPAGAPERRVEASAPADADVDAAPPPPRSVPGRGVERTVLREAESAPAAPPVRAIPSAPPRRAPDAPDAPRTMRIRPAAPVEAGAEVPAPPAPARVHPFTEVLAEARRWVAETPVPGDPRRPEERALAEGDGYVPAERAAGRPRRQHAGITEASEEVHVSIGAITVTIEDPAAARPAPRAPAPRPEADSRSRLSRVYLRPE